MLQDLLGPPQLAALLVLAQRGLEDLYSARNARRLIQAGAYEAGRSYYPVVATVQLAWLGSVFFLVPPEAPVSYPLLVVYLVLQVVRYWSIAALGPYWTYRIVTMDDAPIVREGPYRFMRHPNYAVLIAETFLLPAAFGAWALAIIMAAIESSVMYYKILLEDEALERRRRASESPPQNSATMK